MEQLERQPGVTAAPKRNNHSRQQRSNSFAATISVVSGILGICGFFYGIGWAILPSSTLAEKITILCASGALTAAFSLGIGAWRDVRRFTYTMISSSVAVACLAYLSIAAEDDAVGQSARPDIGNTFSSASYPSTESTPVPGPVSTGSDHAVISSKPAISSSNHAISGNVKPQYLADLTGTGSEWLNSAWNLGGKSYPKSLGVPDPCYADSSVTYRWARSYHHFIATVGVADSGSGDNQNHPIDFAVYADAAQGDQLGAQAAQYGHPTVIDVPLQQGETSITLHVNGGGGCELSTAVWGSARLTS